MKCIQNAFMFKTDTRLNICFTEKGQSMNKQDNEFHTNGDETCDAAINRNRSNLTRPLFWILAASHGVWQVRKDFDRI